MTIENTDLERRVLAHERILQVLIAHMAEDEPKFLTRLKDIFQNGHTLGACEQNFTDTHQYSEQFIRQVELVMEDLDVAGNTGAVVGTATGSLPPNSDAANDAGQPGRPPQH